MGKTCYDVAFPSTLGKHVTTQAHRNEMICVSAGPALPTTPWARRCPGGEHPSHRQSGGSAHGFFQSANLHHLTKRAESVLGNLRSEERFSLGSLPPKSQIPLHCLALQCSLQLAVSHWVSDKQILSLNDLYIVFNLNPKFVINLILILIWY